MSVTHATATRNTLADAVVDQLDSGTIKYVTSGDVEVATCTFAATAFGAAASGTATANAITDDTSATGGTIAKFELQTSAPLSIVFGSEGARSEEHTSELQSLMRISYAVFCLQKKKNKQNRDIT